MAIRLGHDGDDFEETHEINVTPFIDVILVLLIIFMIAAPLATVDIPVELPSTTAQKQERPDKPIFLTIEGAADSDPTTRETTLSRLRATSSWSALRGSFSTTENNERSSFASISGASS